MLLLPTDAFPASHGELHAALSEGLSCMFDLPEGRPAVCLEGSDYPRLHRLSIDLTGATVKRDYRPAPPTGESQPGLTMAHLEVHGRPIQYGPTPLALEIAAEEVRLDLARDERGRTILNPVDALRGRLRTEIRHTDLEALLLAQFRALAAEHGVTVEQTRLTLLDHGNRSVTIRLRVTACKPMLLKIRTTITGQASVAIDDTLNATLSGLGCTGEGVIGALVVGLIQKHLKEWEGRRIPMSTVSLGRLRLHDLHIGCADGLQVEAALGS